MQRLPVKRQPFMRCHMLADYHLHSNFSHDGRNAVDEICQAAIQKGVKEIAITDHYDAEDSLFNDRNYNYEAYDIEIKNAQQHYSNQLTIKSAVELGDALLHRKCASRFIRNNYFDFVLLSVHYIAFADLWSMDYHKLRIDEGLEQYFTHMMDTILCFDDYDCLSHIDLPKRYFKRENILVSMLDYREDMREIFKTVIQKGKGIEVNSSSMRNLLNEPMPSEIILRDYKELGGEIITTGSDAHGTQDIGAGLKDCIDLLKKCGFQYVATYENRKPIFHKI